MVHGVAQGVVTEFKPQYCKKKKRKKEEQILTKGIASNQKAPVQQKK
jgi:hypothetical protein